ncbi:beta-glucosidase BglX [candidate division WOR-3 bacterium]|nr:beta-glucosidase BglX [candidate division WOR-3 bacterium]
MDEFIDSLMNKMTLEEKLGQLAQYAGGGSLGFNTRIDDEKKELVRRGKVGSFLHVLGADFLYGLQKIAVEESRLGIPLIFGLDVVHGLKTIFPVPLASACSFEPEAVERAARIAAIEAAACGIHWTFAPMVDIALDPRWGRIVEGAGEDPYLGAAMAKAQVEGYQGDDLSFENTILACPKHYVAYGAAEGGRDYNSAEVSRRTLYEVYLPPFLAAVKAGAGSLMNGFNDINGEPMAGNKELLTDVLRGKWGFEGFVVSDWNSIAELMNHGVAEDRVDAGKKALSAGIDMDMTSGIFGEEILKSVKKDEISEALVDKAVRRILEAKYKLGLFDDPFQYCKAEVEKSVILKEEHIGFAKEMACKSIVLLKNEDGILPLARDPKKIAVIGPLANDSYTPLGSWKACGEEKDVVTVLEGIRNAVSEETEVLYAEGCETSGDDKGGFEEAVRVASQADVVVLVLGESADMSGEARSRSEIDLPGVQEELAKEILNTGTKVVVILMNGRPLAIPYLAENVPAILETWFLGIQSGNAIADVLFGVYNPGGKLAVTIPRSVGQIPCFYYHKKTGRPATEDATRHSARYFDLPVSPLYPFGHGLSYTEFKYSKLKIKNKKVKANGSLELSFSLKNKGKVSGSEVVQLYVRDVVASIAPPVKKLAGFKRIYLAKGEEKEIKVEMPVNLMAFYNKDMKKVVEPGEIKIMIGSSSEDIRLDDSFIVEGKETEIDGAEIYYSNIYTKK